MTVTVTATEPPRAAAPAVSRLLLATNNPGKVREFRRLLEGVVPEIVSPDELGIALSVDEHGETYAENAALKARAFAAAGGCAALADDSGIEVDALDGRPGPRSARYGGPGLDDVERTQRMLDELSEAPPKGRGARYRAVVALAWPDGRLERFEGTWEGLIGYEFRGEGGFGYDPIFVTTDGRTAAQLSASEKDALSHRGQAVRDAAEWLRDAR
jgi:XTP/dITP diphosphohydrolase